MTPPVAQRGRPPGPYNPDVDTKYRQANRSRRLRWWHEAIIDDMLVYPLSSHEERGKRLGYSKQTIMLLTKSDMFMAAYEERRANLRNRIDDSIAVKMAQVADLGLTVMKESLETKRTAIPFRDLAAANDSMLQRLGYGAPITPASGVQVTVNSPGVTPELLAAARQRIRENEDRRVGEALPPSLQPMIDVTPPPARSSPPAPEAEVVDAGRRSDIDPS